jgi:transcriptional regulator with XRE-family HTH domain
MEDLADALRGWRDRLTPEQVGLPSYGARRTPGLRREELAGLAGVSFDYLVRLEQGRAQHPSTQVLESLARALRLSDPERQHLFQLAGQALPGPDRVGTVITPAVQRLMDRFQGVPVSVNDAAWNVLAWNPLWAALLGDPSDKERNVLRAHFGGQPSRVVRTPEQTAEFEASAVSDVRAVAGRYPDDPDLAALIAELLTTSPRFAELWEEREVSVHAGSTKTIRHPEVGLITIDCDVLSVQGSDVRIIAYTPASGSPDADALALVGVLGLQRI